MRRIVVVTSSLAALSGALLPVAHAATAKPTKQPPECGPPKTGTTHKAACAVPAPHRADGKLGDWVGRPTMIAGRTTTSLGEYIYTDWLYDDYGPDLDGNVNQP